MEPQAQDNTVTSDLFYRLYQRVIKDEDVVKIGDAPGITIIRKYNENTRYFKDGKKIFIKFYIRDGCVLGTVDMLEKNENGSYTIYDSQKIYDHPLTNFSLSKSDEITFSGERRKFLIKRSYKTHELSVNDFVDLLVKNHLDDALFWRRKFNKIKVGFLIGIFWLVDKKYEWIKYQDKINKKNINPNPDTSSDDSHYPKMPDDKNEIDPFFNYFHIYRKILLIAIMIIAPVIYYLFCKARYIRPNDNFLFLFEKDNFTIANPIFIFFFFIILFALHYTCSILKRKIYEKNSFVYKLHESFLNNSFSLKIHLPK